VRNDLWGDDWPEVRAHWMLDPRIDFLNHGSFGACTRPVLRAQDGWRARMEAEPVRFLYRELPDLLRAAARSVATFAGADPDGTVFVRNATEATNAIVASLRLGPGDEVVTTDHAYSAVRNLLRVTSERTGIVVKVVEVPLPLPSEDEICARVEAALTERTRLAIFDHVSSPTAVVFPAARLAALFGAHGGPVLIDGAHAPGMLDLSVAETGADFYTGNLHKWVCAPKGTAFLNVSSAWRHRIRPVIVSHDYLQTFQDLHTWGGTDDPSAHLSAPDAIAFMEEIGGWERVRAHNIALARAARAIVADAIRVEPLVPDDATGSMAVIPLDGVEPTIDAAAAIQARLYNEHRIEVPITPWNGRALLRVSAAAYNAPEQYERLGRALRELLRS
jgi:isopenicillin-N epimerase